MQLQNLNVWVVELEESFIFLLRSTKLATIKRFDSETEIDSAKIHLK
jgi:hypothetical protein